MIQTNTPILHNYSCFSVSFVSLVPVLNNLLDHHNLPLLRHAAILVPVNSISIRTLGFFVSIKTISIDTKLTFFKFFCLSNNPSKPAESSGKSVIVAAVLAWNPRQALSLNPKFA